MREVIIAGGGLAGAVTGLWLQHHGIQPTILEQRRSAYSTLCAEGVALRTLRKLDPVFDARRYIAQELPGATWSLPGTAIAVHEPCATMDRDAWIPAMLDAFEARGGTIAFGRRWTRKDARDEDAVLIGCDGPGSKVRRLVPWANVDIRPGLQVRVPYETDRLQFWTDKRWSNEYAWAFPRGDTCNVGILGEGTAEDRRRLEAFVTHLGVEPPEKHQAYPIATGGDRVGTQDGSVLLMGDAAGLTNPITKGGIAAILHAAPILASAVADGAPERYVASLRRHPLRHPSYRRAMQRMRKYSHDELEKTLAPLPQELHLGGPESLTRRTAARLASRIIVRQPHRARDAWTFFQAARHSAKWSW